jgi:hypothetical protein
MGPVAFTRGVAVLMPINVPSRIRGSGITLPTSMSQ